MEATTGQARQSKHSVHRHEVDGAGTNKALSWSNLLFGMRAYIQRDNLMVVFLEVVVQSLYAASTARQHSRVQSRHLGRNPKLDCSASPAHTVLSGV